jgi:hypothetical protein
MPAGWALRLQSRSLFSHRRDGTRTGRILNFVSGLQPWTVTSLSGMDGGGTEEERR